MKKALLPLFALWFFFLFADAKTETNPTNDPVKLGSISEMINKFSDLTQRSASAIEFQIAKNRSVQIEVINNDCHQNNCYVFGKVAGHETATFFIRGDDKKVNGKILFQKEKEAYDIYSDHKGNIYIAPIDIHEVICFEYPEYVAADGATGEYAPVAKTNPESMSPPLLNSNLGATRTLYLDFDGENVTNSNWGNINAAPSNFSNANITTIWTCVSEDYSPFDINITTDRNVFNSAPSNRRMMVIFTPTNDAAPGAGGVAFLNSFGGSEPCWVFNSSVKSAEEAAAHEAGHTFGLSHDGTSSAEYYTGHGSWGPIMGAVYTRPIVQWSKGEYNGASQQQNDLSILSSRVPYRIDDHGSTLSTASTLTATPGSGTVNSSNKGIIERTTDIDLFEFSTSGGSLNLTIKPKTESGSASIPDLDIQARLLDVSGNQLLIANPSGVLTTNVTLSTSLSAGTYYLEIDGVGTGNVNTGYSDYGSLGQYFISGTISGYNTSVYEHGDETQIGIFPNPSNGNFNVRLDAGNLGQCTIEVFNHLGELVLIDNEIITGKFTKPISLKGQLSTGVYCIVVKGEKTFWSKKIVIY